MEFIRKAIKLGNSAGVILPRKLLGSEVKVSIISRPVEIKKEALKHLDSYLDEISGIYVLSHMPIEILAITSGIKKIIDDSRMKIVLVPISQIMADLKENNNLRKKIISAEIILNKNLLSSLKKIAGKNKPRKKL